MSVVTFPMAAGKRFDWHTHTSHQLAWAASGVLTVRAQDTAWVLPPTRALWIPAGVRHETLTEGQAATTMRSLYVRPEAAVPGWACPTPVVAHPLLTGLIGYLEQPTLADEARARGEAVMADLLEPVPMTTIEVRFPDDDRARAVAEALRHDPASPRTLAQCGHEVGTSGRTLARVFLAETGLPFGRWRTLLRLQCALPALAAGEPAGNVARRVGYETPSAFTAAFRRETGITPAGYFR
jgi:AraC-like DNA-binding protein